MVSECLHTSSTSESEGFAPRRGQHWRVPSAAPARGRPPASTAGRDRTALWGSTDPPSRPLQPRPTASGARRCPRRPLARTGNSGRDSGRSHAASPPRTDSTWPPRSCTPRPGPARPAQRGRLPGPAANLFSDWLPPPWAPPTPARGPVHGAAVLVGLAPSHSRFGPREGAPPRGLVGWQGACASPWPRPSCPRSRSSRRCCPCSGLVRRRPPSRHGGRRGGAVPFPRSPAKEGDRRRLLPRPLPRLRRARGAASRAGHRRGPGGAGHAGEGRWGGAAPRSGPESRRRAALGGLRQPAWGGAPALCRAALWDCGERRPRFRGAGAECGAGAFIRERPWPPGGPRRRREQGTPLKGYAETCLLTVPAKHAFEWAWALVLEGGGILSSGAPKQSLREFVCGSSC